VADGIDAVCNPRSGKDCPDLGAGPLGIPSKDSAYPFPEHGWVAKVFEADAVWKDQFKDTAIRQKFSHGAHHANRIWNMFHYMAAVDEVKTVGKLLGKIAHIKIQNLRQPENIPCKRACFRVQVNIAGMAKFKRFKGSGHESTAAPNVQHPRFGTECEASQPALDLTCTVVFEIAGIRLEQETVVKTSELILPRQWGYGASQAGSALNDLKIVHPVNRLDTPSTEWATACWPNRIH
jgi:hypothetical protein